MQHNLRHKMYLEFFITLHCNLKCTNCSAASPYFKPSYNSFEQFKRDCDKLKEFYTIDAARFTGGEALLHPDVAKFISYPKEIGLAKVNCVVTNGISLLSAKDDFWEAVDYIHISVYRGTGINYEKIYNHVAKKMKQYPHIKLLEATDIESVKNLESYKTDIEDKGVDLNLSYGYFKKIHTKEVKTDQEAQELYNQCWMKNSCYIVNDGRLYKCPMSLVKSKLYEQENIKEPFDLSGDSVDLFSANARLELDQLLDSDRFLNACKTCNGFNTAPDEPQSQLKSINISDII